MRNIKIDKLNSFIISDNIPHQVPENWAWTNMEYIVNYLQRGRSPKYVENSPIKVISQKCVQWDGFQIDKVRCIDEKTKNKYTEERFIRIYDILWNSTGTGTIGRVAIVNEKYKDLMVADSHVTVVRVNNNLIFPKYLFFWLSGPFIQNGLTSSYSGSTNQVELSIGAIKEKLVPLPPLKEQKRIAEKIESLFSKIDEAKHLIDEAKESFEIRWAAISDKAFRGGLTKEWREKTPVSTDHKKTMEDIENERIKLGLKSKKVDSNLSRPLIELPDSWNWTLLNDITIEFKNGIYKSVDFYGENGIPCLRMYNINKNELNLNNMHYMKLTPDEIKDYGLEYGDILINRVNSKELVGKCAAVPEKFPKSVFESKNIRIRLSSNVNPFYISMVLSLPYIKKLIYKSIKQTVGMATISQEFLKRIPIPLPPLQEQNKIVEIVNKLFDHEKNIEFNLVPDTDVLKQSILQKAFQGELGTNDPTEESIFEMLKYKRAMSKNV